MTVTRRIRRRGERGISRKTIAQGMPGCSDCTCMLACVSSHNFAHETAGAASTRRSLRPLLDGRRIFNGSGASRGEGADSHLHTVIVYAPSLQAAGSRECAPDDRLREAIHLAAQRKNGLLRCARNDVESQCHTPSRHHPRMRVIQYSRDVGD
jgi:hypothetical protein